MGPHIQFTHEVENQNSLPFLDVRVTRKEQGNLETSVYRKDTHTDHYLSFTSHHPSHQKLGVVHTLSCRAHVVSSNPDALQAENKHLKEALTTCDYPRWMINKGIRTRHHEDSEADHTDDETMGEESNSVEAPDQSKGYVTLPYIKGTTEAISRVLNKAGFKVAMKPCRTLRQELVAPKDKVSLLDKAGVVYQIPCGDCSASYIGHTGKNLRDRVKQHKATTDKGKTNDSAIAEHSWSSHHSIDWENVKVLDQESIEKRRQIKESLLIRSKAPEMNRDLGLEVSEAYSSIIQLHTGPPDGNSRGRPSDVTTH